VLMASKMLMAGDALPSHLSSGLVIGINFVIILIEDLIGMSCISRDRLFICKRQVSCFITMNKVSYGHIMIMNWLFLFYSR